MPYCPNCGAENEADAAFCESCGSPLRAAAAPPQSPPPPAAAEPPPPTPPAPPAAGRRFPWVAIGGIVVLVAVIAGGVLAYNALSDDENGKDAVSDEEDKETMAAPTATERPTAEATETVEPSPSPKPSPTKPPPTEEMPVIGWDTPARAIAAYFDQYGIDYAGDCSQADLETDAGKYCWMSWADRGDTLIYVIGPTFSEPDTWLLLAWQEGGGWLVVDAIQFIPGPQDTVPPWP